MQQRALVSASSKLTLHNFCLADMRRDVQEVFRSTPRTKQVMMFSATLSKEIRPTCKKFMQNVSVVWFVVRNSTLGLIHNYPITASGDLRG